MANLNLAEAYAKYGARAANRTRARSAVATDGSVVITCASSDFARPSLGILRYEAKLAEASTDDKGTSLLRQHITLAHSDELPVRLVIITPSRGSADRTVHVRPDLQGKVTELDAEHFVIDFTRLAPAARETKLSRKR